MSEKMEINNFGKKILSLKVKSYESDGDILDNIIVINDLYHIFYHKAFQNGSVFAQFISVTSKPDVYIRLGGADDSKEILKGRYQKLLEGYHELLLCDGGILKEIEY